MIFQELQSLELWHCWKPSIMPEIMLEKYSIMLTWFLLYSTCFNNNCIIKRSLGLSKWEAQILESSCSLAHSVNKQPSLWNMKSFDTLVTISWKMDSRDRFYGFSLLFNIFAEKNTYYAGIMLDAPSIVLCSKLCRHNVSDPNDNAHY